MRFITKSPLSKTKIYFAFINDFYKFFRAQKSPINFLEIRIAIPSFSPDAKRYFLAKKCLQEFISIISRATDKCNIIFFCNIHRMIDFCISSNAAEHTRHTFFKVLRKIFRLIDKNIIDKMSYITRIHFVLDIIISKKVDSFDLRKLFTQL